MLGSQKLDVDTSPTVRVRGKLDTDDPSKWLSRNEAVDMLNCSRQTLLNYEQRDLLHPRFVVRTDARGARQRIAVYHQDELKKLAIRMKRVTLRDPGDVAARAFELFGEGRKLAEVVVSLRVMPVDAERLHAQWLDMGGSDLVITPTAKAMLEKIVGPFETVAELIQKIGGAESTTDAADVAAVNGQSTAAIEE